MSFLAKILGKRFLYGIAISILFLLMMVLLFGFLTRDEEVAQAQKAFFYPETCLGGWKSAKNASGVPEALQTNEYTANNSAVFKDGDAAIFCGEFKGELPPQTYQTRVTLRFSWQQEVVEPVVTEEGTLLDVIVDIFTDDNEEGDGSKQDAVNTEEQTDVLTATTTDSMTEVVSTSTEVISDEVATSTEAGTDNNDTDTDTDTSTEVTEEGDTSVSGDANEEGDQAKTEEVETEIAPSTEPEPEPVEEVAPEPASEPISWLWRWVNTVYAEEMSTTTEVVGVIEPESLSTTTDIVSTATEEVMIEEDLSLPEVVDAQVDDVSQEQVEAIFAVEYTLDGKEWQNIGYVTTIDNDLRFELPKEALVSIEDVNQVQIALRPLLRLDSMPEIYLDSMWFEISYAPVRELGVHALSSLTPEEFTFDEFFSATGTVGASSTVQGMDPVQLIGSSTFIHGIDGRYALVGLPQNGVTELWLLDMDLREIKRLGFNEAAIDTYPLGAKERMIFWLNYDASIIFTYDLRTGGSLHEMALVGNLPQDEERRFTFPFTDWQVVWRANELYFFKDSPGEVFKDENAKAVDRLMTYLQNQIEIDNLENIINESVSTTTESDIATTTETQNENI